MKKNTKNINIQVSLECWKIIKKISIDRENTLQEVVQEILEKQVGKGIKKEVLQVVE
jgi:hypothetical protein